MRLASFRSCVLFAAALGAFAAPAIASAQNGAVAVVQDGIASARVGGPGVVLVPWQPGAVFTIAVTSDRAFAALAAILKRAREDSRAVTFRFDATHGRVDRAAEAISFPLCGIALDDLTAEPDTPCNPAAANAAQTPAALLAAGTAWLMAGKLPRAAPYFSRLTPTDADARDPVLLRARANFAAAMASETGDPLAAAADRWRVQALRDLRALASLRPADMDTAIEVGSMLEELGGYTEARAYYERLLAAHPDEAYRLRIRIGAIYRQQGDYIAALGQLDQLARSGKDGATGMKYLYHRGWTLMKLGRYAEAADALTKGLGAQPDYAWAYMRRACANARLDRTAAAHSDVDRAAALVQTSANSYPTPAMVKLASDTRALAAAMAARPQSAERICSVGPRSEENARPRSPLLTE